MKKTSNYKLSLYESTDAFNITAAENSLNANMEIIDSALKEKIKLSDIPTATSDQAGLTVVYPQSQCVTYTSDDGACTPAAVKKAVETFGINAGGNVTGHIYLTGAKPSSSTGNTSQVIFGTKASEHVALSSNSGMLVINPSSTSAGGQILLKLNGASTFPKGIQAAGVTPPSNNTYALGSSGARWSNIYATNFNGSAVILTSPNGTQYKLTVSDDGALSTTKV